MRPVLKAFLLLLGLAVVIGGAGLWYFLDSGVSAKEQPGRLEEFVAGRARNMAIARRAKSLTNPVEYSGEIIADGRAHFADHCATCHGNNGSGDTPIGRGMWPKPPDMRLERTQHLSDGDSSGSSRTAFASPVCRRGAQARRRAKLQAGTWCTSFGGYRS
jgi:cytochrome c553